MTFADIYFGHGTCSCCGEVKDIVSKIVKEWPYEGISEQAELCSQCTDDVMVTIDRWRTMHRSGG